MRNAIPQAALISCFEINDSPLNREFGDCPDYTEFLTL